MVRLSGSADPTKEGRSREAAREDLPPLRPRTPSSDRLSDSRGTFPSGQGSVNDSRRIGRA